MWGLLCSTVEVFVCLIALPVWFAYGKLTLNYFFKKKYEPSVRDHASKSWYLGRQRKLN